MLLWVPEAECRPAPPLQLSESGPTHLLHRKDEYLLSIGDVLNMTWWALDKVKPAIGAMPRTMSFQVALIFQGP